MVVFLYVLFPAETARAYIQQKANRSITGVRFSIEAVKPALPPGLTLKGLMVSHERQPLLHCPKLTATPAYTDLASGKASFRFKGRPYGGRLKGRVRWEKTAAALEQTLIEAHLSGVPAEKIETLKKMLGGAVSGKLAADIVFQNEGRGQKPTPLKIVIEDAKIEPEAPFMGLGQVLFEKVAADVIISADRLQVKRLIATGSELESSLSGAVRLKKPLGQSRLTLRGTIRFHHKLLSKLDKKTAATVGLAIKTGNGRLPLNVSGTLEKPVVRFR